jgi:hypothetical protein
MSFIYAPHEHAQHPRHRVLSVACPRFLAVADIKGDVGATRERSGDDNLGNRLLEQGNAEAASAHLR